MLVDATSPLCIQCFSHEMQHAKCPQCGFDERKHHSHPLYLAPRTLLKDQYIIGKPIGQGGFGVTYLGFDIRLEKKVAIKEYLPAALVTRDLNHSTIVPIKQQETAFATGLQFFIEEAKNLAKFTHPHIVSVMNFFEANNTGYMVMEYLQGQTLSEKLTNSKLPVEDALTILFPLLEALQTIHTQHVYHRDISAHNVFILEEGTPILIDFGAARHIVGEHSQSLDLVLKHGYSPLEQYSGKGKIGPWTDIYACGALLYLLITGKLPPAATDRYAEDNLVSPNKKCLLSESLNQAILQALAVKIEDRFQSVDAFKLALQGNVVSSPKPKSILKPIVVTAFILLGLISVLYYVLFIQPIQRLFEQAQQQWSQSKLVSPKGDNAYTTYQHILRLDPSNVQALAGIERLKQHYIQSISQFQTRAQFEESWKLTEQGLRVFPNNKALQQLQQQLAHTLAKRKQEAEIEQLLHKAQTSLAHAQRLLAYEHYQNVLRLRPQHVEANIGLQQVATSYVHALETEFNPNLLEQALHLFPNNPSLKQLQVDFEKQNDIQLLQQKAARQLANIYLTEPKGNNAYETYQQILALDPNNSQAHTGMSNIVDAYEKLAISVKKQKEKSLAFIQKGLSINPTHAGLLRLKQQLTQPEKETPVHPPVQPITQIVQVQPIVSNENSQEDQLQALLTLAQQQFNAKRLEAAAYTYQNILALEKNNVRAKQGLDNIVQHYEQLARKAYQAQQLSKSLGYIEKALNIHPNHTSLVILQNKIKQQQADMALAERKKSEPSSNETDELTPDVQEEQTSSMIFTPTF